MEEGTATSMQIRRWKPSSHFQKNTSPAISVNCCPLLGRASGVRPRWKTEENFPPHLVFAEEFRMVAITRWPARGVPPNRAISRLNFLQLPAIRGTCAVINTAIAEAWRTQNPPKNIGALHKRGIEFLRYI